MVSTTHKVGTHNCVIFFLPRILCPEETEVTSREKQYESSSYQPMSALLRCLLGVNKASVILSAQHPMGVFFVFCFAFHSCLTSFSCQNHVLEIVGEPGCKDSRFVGSVHQRRSYLLEGTRKRVLSRPELRTGRDWQNGSEDSSTSWKTTSFYSGDRSPGFIVYRSQMGSKNVCLRWEISLIPYSWQR